MCYADVLMYLIVAQFSPHFIFLTIFLSYETYLKTKQSWYIKNLTKAEFGMDLPTTIMTGVRP